MTDQELLTAYFQKSDEHAFRAIVERYVDLVFSSARRQMRDAESAEDVVQAVFIVLAQRGGRIRDSRRLGAWLLKVTRFCAAEARRNAMRRRKYEQGAAAMTRTVVSGDMVDDEQVGRHLDASLSALRSGDRDVLVHRYLREESLAQVGKTLGISEEAAKKRVARALERLRKVFAKRGVAMSIAVMSVALGRQVIAAPAGMAALVGRVGLGSGTAGVPSEIAWHVMKRMRKAGILAGGGVVMAVAILMTFAIVGHRSRGAPQPSVASGPVVATAAQTPESKVKMMNLQELIAALEARRERIKSIEWSTTLEIGVVDGKAGATQSSKYGQAGERVYFTQQRDGTGETRYVSDGKSLRMVTLNHQANMPLTGTGAVYPLGGSSRFNVVARNREDPSGFTGEYICNFDLLTSMKGGHVTLTPHWVEEDGVPCYELQGDGIPREMMAPNVPPETLAKIVPPTFRLLLDPAHSFMPRRIEGVIFSDAAPYNKISSSIMDRFEFEKTGAGIWFVVAARERGFAADAAGGPDKELAANLIHAKVESINQAIPEERFVVDFPAGTRVIDYSDATLEGGIVHQRVIGRPEEDMDLRQVGGGRMVPIFPRGGGTPGTARGARPL